MGQAGNPAGPAGAGPVAAAGGGAAPALSVCPLCGRPHHGGHSPSPHPVAAAAAGGAPKIFHPADPAAAVRPAGGGNRLSGVRRRRGAGGPGAELERPAGEPAEHPGSDRDHVRPAVEAGAGPAHRRGGVGDPGVHGVAEQRDAPICSTRRWSIPPTRPEGCRMWCWP